jgi:N utilization substance protein B
MKSIGARRQGRMIALQTLYEYDLGGHGLEGIIERHAAQRNLPPRVVDFAKELVQGVLSHVSTIDAQIEQATPRDWPLPQMAKIDKNILRLAIYEILFNNTVPAKAAINEAVELAKVFGSENSSRFVNGVLGTIFSRAHGAPTSGAESEVR